MDFTDIEFLNKDFTPIQTNDIFDAMESVALRVEAEYEGDEPPPAVGVILRSDINQDTIVVDVSLDDTQWDIATYTGVLPAGIFTEVIGDPDDVLPPYSEAEISAEPVPIDCPTNPPSAVAVDILTIANFQLWVEQINFEFDYDLFKDDNSTYPPTEEPISDPVWVKDTKSDPVAYRRGNSLLMNVLVECNRTPYHDFEYWIMASGGEGQGSYITAVCEGHLNHSNQGMVNNVAPRDGPFPNHVGIIDPLNYLWWVKKIPGPNMQYFKFMNSSWHKIFLTYDTPLLQHVNILGLDKICNYAQGEKEPPIIAELGVGGVYGEGWGYDPGHPVFSDPLNVIRQDTGQCADYANLLTYLYKSIGIPSNSVTIYNGANFGGTDYRLYWVYSTTGNFTCVLSKWLTACDGESNLWPFNYHSVSWAAGLLCDATFCIADSRANYDEWWRYYLHPRNPNPPYSHVEPPPIEPIYYDWSEFTPSRPMPLGVQNLFILFWHP
jgi:hypothetical protein